MYFVFIWLNNIVETSFNQRNAAILHDINLGDKGARILEKITALAENLKFYRCIF